MTDSKRILLIEDTVSIAKSVTLALQPEGFSVTVTPTLADARAIGNLDGFAVALVDVMLPDGSGLDFCAELKMRRPDLPVIIITAKVDEDTAVQGLALANDYVRKPFGKRELLARINKALSQTISTTKLLDFEGLRLNPATCEVSFAGKTVVLRPKEAAILSVLLLGHGDPVSRERILQLVDKEGEMYDRSLDAHVSRIRKALAEAQVRPVEIAAVPGTGYRLRKKA